MEISPTGKIREIVTHHVVHNCHYALATEHGKFLIYQGSGSLFEVTDWSIY